MSFGEAALYDVSRGPRSELSRTSNNRTYNFLSRWIDSANFLISGLLIPQNSQHTGSTPLNRLRERIHC